MEAHKGNTAPSSWTMSVRISLPLGPDCSPHTTLTPSRDMSLKSQVPLSPLPLSPPIPSEWSLAGICSSESQFLNQSVTQGHLISGASVTCLCC